VSSTKEDGKVGEGWRRMEKDGEGWRRTEKDGEGWRRWALSDTFYINMLSVEIRPRSRISMI
jgi:hypothetical protein